MTHASSLGMTNATKARLALETTHTSLNALVRRVTAFQTFSDMVAQCRTGYVPTIIPRKLSGRASVAACLDEHAKELITSGLQALGLKVWNGQN